MENRIKELIGIVEDRICSILAHFPIAQHEGLDSPYFETEIFLCALLGASFPDSEDMSQIALNRLELYAAEANELIINRMYLLILPTWFSGMNACNSL